MSMSGYDTCRLHATIRLGASWLTYGAMPASAQYPLLGIVARAYLPALPSNTCQYLSTRFPASLGIGHGGLRLS